MITDGTRTLMVASAELTQTTLGGFTISVAPGTVFWAAHLRRGRAGVGRAGQLRAGRHPAAEPRAAAHRGISPGVRVGHLEQLGVAHSRTHSRAISAARARTRGIVPSIQTAL